MLRILTEPATVMLVARTRLDVDAVSAALEARGLEWRHENMGDAWRRTRPALDVYGRDGGLLAEFAARGCYNSFGGPNGAGMGRATNAEHVGHLIDVGHGSVLEHCSFTFLVYGCSRGFTHELVRHRHLSFSQASTRFRDESAGALVVPPLARAWLREHTAIRRAFETVASTAAAAYDQVVDTAARRKLAAPLGLQGTAARKAFRGAARNLLPIGLESPIVVTGNARAWRGFLDQRASPFAEAEIREIAMRIWRILAAEEPDLFGDYAVQAHTDGSEFLVTKHVKV